MKLRIAQLIAVGLAWLLALGNPTTAGPLPDLSFAEHEVRVITDLYGTQALVGAEATESVLWSGAKEAGILHLAAHGEYNPFNPLFSAIHLAGGGEHDGRLEVHEVYGLALTAATDLVVLSACQTHLGDLSEGDELVGLTRAFIYAGTPTVVASLWSVDDESTALLMERFYTHLREGIGKAEALRQAQLEVREEYPNPYYWAGFVLSGDGGEVGDIRPTTSDETGTEEIGATATPAPTKAPEAASPSTEPASEPESEGAPTGGVCPGLILPLFLLSIVYNKKKRVGR